MAKELTVAELSNAFASIEQHNLLVSEVFVPIGQTGNDLIGDLISFYSINVSREESRLRASGDKKPR